MVQGTLELPDREGREARALCAAIAILVGLLLVPSRLALAADCSVSAIATVSSTREAALVEAGGFAANGRWADARAVYLWVLARYEDDPEALAGLARVDSWGGCWALAEREYRLVLAAHPEDSDVRAGYADLLMWRGHLDDAERAVAEGLALDPRAPSLLVRAGRFASWRGDAAAAARLGDLAVQGSPDDDEIRAIRDRFFLGEARLTGRADIYAPSQYQSVYTVTAQGLERVGRFELSGAAQLVDREGGGVPPVHDARYPIGLTYHPAMGWSLGAEVALGAPAVAIPNVTVRGWLVMPVFGPVDASFSYDFWHFNAHDERVHLLNPGLGLALPKDLRLDVRAWIAVVQITAPKVGGAAGAQLTWSPTPRIDLAATLTYGQELEPGLFLGLDTYTGPSATVFSDVLINRHFGFRPVAGWQRLRSDQGPAHTIITIYSAELGAYGRW